MEFMVYNYVNFIIIFLLVHCCLYIIYITIYFNTFEAYFSCVSHILTI